MKHLTLLITRKVQLTGHRSSIYTMAEIPGTSQFLSAGGDGWIVGWDKRGEQEDGTLLAQVEGKIFSLQYCTDQDLLLAGDMNGHLYFIDLKQKKTVKRLVLHKGSLFDILVFGKYALTCGADGFISLVDIEKMLPEISIEVSRSGLRCMAKDTNHVYIGGSDNAIHQLHLSSLEKCNTKLQAHGNSVFSLCIDHKGTLFSGGRDALLKSHRLPSMEEEQSVQAHWYTINRLVGLQDNYLISASRDKTVRVWNTESMTLVKSLDAAKGGHVNSVNHVLVFEKEGMMATCGDDRSVILWKILPDIL